jgi:alanyl-tRNA synthetase
MKYLTTSQIRQLFLDFFHEHGHEIVASSSLVPENDPTLLLTNAGMNQFKDTFLGVEKRAYNRATTSQKCMRVSGKHNDLENVGPSPRHHTFFEMLGNFSFGDYFKQDAIRFAWQLLVDELGLPLERLWFTVYTDDAEAERLWIEAGADPTRVRAFGKKDNWWSMGDTGPCGPCSEIHYYWGDLTLQDPAASTRMTNTWRSGTWSSCSTTAKADGTLVPLPAPSVDTGAGLERIRQHSPGQGQQLRHRRLRMPIMDRIQQLCRPQDEQRQEHLLPLPRHRRPRPRLQLYDWRRRAARQRRPQLCAAHDPAPRRPLWQVASASTDPFLAKIADVVIDEMGGHYTDLVEKRDFILQHHHRRGRALPSHAGQRAAHPRRADGKDAR